MQLPPFELERYFARYEFAVDFLLGSSDCESCRIQDLLELESDAQPRFAAHWLGYTESAGSPSLREAIGALYETISPDDVLVHTGAEEAIFLFMHAMLQPGDHVIVHWPCYQSLIEVARSAGAEVTRWQAHPENSWALNLDELRALLQPNTRAVVVNTPHNPTGYLMQRDDFLTLHNVVREHGALLFCDEVYRESEHDEQNRLPAACDLSDRAISLGVMSKTYGLAGLRIGWLATRNQDVLAAVSRLKDYTTICNSAPSEFLAELALRHRRKLIERNLSILRDNLDVLDRFFADHPQRFTWIRPRAGAIAFPRLFNADVATFCSDLVQRTGVMLVPGTVFGDVDGHFRIGFGRKNLPEAVERLDAYLRDSR